MAKGPPAPPPSREEARSLLRSLREAGAGLASRRSLDLAQALGAAGSRLRDPADPLRSEAEAKVANEAGVSRPMASEIIEGMAASWEAQPLEQLLRTEFPDPAILDGFRPDRHGQEVRAFGGSLSFHIGSGNVPGVGATSMIRSLLVKCPILLKPGQGDIALSCLFMRALTETDRMLGKAAAIRYWPAGKGGELEALAIAEADRVVAYGGNDLIANLRSRLPPTTPLVAYHHRLSGGAVARETLGSIDEAAAVAREAARAIATFDQRGCVSPQVIWVEEGGPVRPVEWAELLSEGLEALSATLPPGKIGAGEAALLQQQVGTFEMQRAAGTGHRVFGRDLVQGRVFYDPGRFLADPLLATCRSVVVKPISDLSALSEVLRPASRVLQSFGLVAPEERRRALATSLAMLGVTRVTTFGRQPWPRAWWRHDGTEPLRALVNWVELESAD